MLPFDQHTSARVSLVLGLMKVEAIIFQVTIVYCIIMNSIMGNDHPYYVQALPSITIPLHLYCLVEMFSVLGI